MLGVDADADGAPRRVDEADRVVDEGHALERRQIRPLGHGLRVVRDGPSDRVPDHDQELDVAGHVVYPGRDSLRDEVARGFLHRYLALDGRRHLASATRKYGNVNNTISRFGHVMRSTCLSKTVQHSEGVGSITPKSKWD